MRYWLLLNIPGHRRNTPLTNLLKSDNWINLISWKSARHTASCPP